MEVVSPIPCSPPSSPPPQTSSSSSAYTKRPPGHNFFNSFLNFSSDTSSTPPLSRASSALNLFYASQSLPHSPGDAPPSPGQHASPSVSMSTATATGTLRAPRRPPSAALPFVPLTPIMASPRLTPQPATIVGASPRSSSVIEDGPLASGGSLESHTTSEESQPQVNDYLACGGQHASSSLVILHPPPLAHITEATDGAPLAQPPTWTSTPPTPPPKLSMEMFPSRSVSRSSRKNRSKSRSNSRARAITVAGDPVMHSLSSPARAKPMPSSSSLASEATVTTVPRGRHPTQAALLIDGEKEKRRMSLPPNLSQVVSNMPMRGTAQSSPARNAGRGAASPLRAVRSRVRRQGSRKLFHLGDTEVSEGEAEGGEQDESASVPAKLFRRLSRRSSKSSRSSRERLADDAREREPRMALDLEREPEAIAPPVPDPPPPTPVSSVKTTDSQTSRHMEKEKEEERRVVSEAEGERLRAATRKYHALMELLATEAGYLMDLRALVTVYLEQLPTLSTASAAVSTSPTLSISSLGLSRSLPSSRSSFLHTSQPSPPPSTSSHSNAGDDPVPDVPEKKREKSKERLKDKHKEKLKEKNGEKDSAKGREGSKNRHKGKEKHKEERPEDGEKDGETEAPVAAQDPLALAIPRSQSYHARKHQQTQRRPIFSEKDVQAVCRNAQELLRFHDRFVSELREAVAGFGLTRAFEIGELGEEVGMRLDGSETAVLPILDDAVALVAGKFVDESPSFGVYQGFCPGHNEAANLIRTVQETYPVEWDAYEQRCSLLVAHHFDLVHGPAESRSEGHDADGLPMPTSATVSPLNPPVVEGTRTKRRHSTSSLTVTVSSSHSALPKVTLNHSEPGSSEHSRSKSGQEHGNVFSRQQSQQAARLKFLDYLIKPVQRICKYPLLLDQLKTKRSRTQSALDPSTRPSSLRSQWSFKGVVRDGGDAVERAGEAMRLVVSLVNRASEVQAHLVQSSMISSRMVFTQPTVGPLKDSHTTTAGNAHRHATATGRTQDLAPEFVSTLGAVRLAGALDVVHHPSALHMVSTGSMRAKYLGAFLYAGGYLILVKIPKSGKVYEPRHWFSLGGFDLFDFEGDESSLPFSFHLCGHGHHLQLAAACQPEKVIWMSAIQDAVSASPPWHSEPPSSLLMEDKAQSAPPVDEAPTEWNATHLPTIMSQDFEGQGEEQEVDSATHGKGKLESRSRPPSRMDSLAFRQEQQAQMASFAALNRRSSTASVKAFFSPMTLDPSTRIPRPSGQVRQQVDHGLHDVFSEELLATRSNAAMKHEELFKRPSASMSRSNSGLSISGAMGLATRRRYDMASGKRGSMDAPREPLHEPEIANKRLNTLPSRTKSLAPASNKHKKQLPSLVPSGLTKVDSEAESEDQTTQSPVRMTDSPFPLSQCSSTTSSNLPSPVDVVGPILGDIAPDATLRQSDVLTAPIEDWRPKRTRSMVDNVKYFFQSRPASPSSTSSHQSATAMPPPPPPPPLEVEPPEALSGLTQWWKKGSLRRRVQSSPDVPGEETAGPSSLVSRSSAEGHGVFLVRTTPEDSKIQPSTSSPSSPAVVASSSSRKVSFNDSAPTRRRSLFTPSSRHRDGSSPQPSSEVPTPLPRRSLRNVLFFQRSSSFTPMDVKQSSS